MLSLEGENDLGMDPWEEKMNKREMKNMNEHFYMIGYVADAHFGIPSCFPCGGRIVDEVSTNPKYLADSSTLPGSRYFSCKDFDVILDFIYLLYDYVKISESFFLLRAERWPPLSLIFGVQEEL